MRHPRTPRPTALRPLLAAALGAALLAAPAHAQLRPLEPLPWTAFDPGHRLTAQAGVGLLHHQPATLAGTVGRLGEFGDYQAAWRAGRIAMEIHGTALRAFRDESRAAVPESEVESAGPRRVDSGDHAIATIVRLTPDRPSFATLRFGTRLPNSDNRIGLDRDRTDFFALVGGQLRRGAYRVGAEGGLGIFGTRVIDFEQTDVFAYTASMRREGPLVTAIADLTGHYTPFIAPRGNEDRSETRLGLQLGQRVWLRALWVHGLTDASPGEGILLSVGAWH